MTGRIQGVTPKDYNGRHYRSTLEADTARTLDLLGIPFEYESQRITLLEGFKCPYQKDKVRAITYTPDFIIGPIIIECKGFETPEWLLKKKYLFKYLMENDPDTIFYQIKDSRKSLLKALDSHWSYLGYAIEVSSKKRNHKDWKPVFTKRYESVEESLHDLGLVGKSLGSILKSLTGKSEFVYGYKWKLIKVAL